MDRLIVLPSATWSLSHHALRRMSELRVGRGLLADTLANPLIRWPARNSCIELVGDRIIATVDEASANVVTVKLRCDLRYQHGVHHLNNIPA